MNCIFCGNGSQEVCKPCEESILPILGEEFAEQFKAALLKEEEGIETVI
jgi:hypothetical protein